MNESRSNIWLYAHPSMSRLAEALEQLCKSDSTFALNEESRTDKEEYKRQSSHRATSQVRNVEYKIDKLEWKKFRDGFPNLFIQNVKHMAGKDIILLASFHSPDVIFEQLSVMYAIPRYLARSFTIILPYFPTGTMERVDTEGQIATAKSLAHLLSSVPLTARGPAQIIVFDIHCLQERFYFSENVIPRLLSAIPLLLRELKQLPDSDEIAIAFPDDGAYKRFHSMFAEDRLIVCAKTRDKDKRIVRVKDGSPTGLHVVIVDDLVMTGGTLLECAKVLIQHGACAVSAYVSHAIFPESSWKQFVGADSVFRHFWITDTLPHAYELCQHPPFRLLSVSDVIADTLLGYDLLQ